MQEECNNRLRGTSAVSDDATPAVDAGGGDGESEPYPSAAGDGPTIEKMLHVMDEEIAAIVAQQEAEASSSKIEKLEGMIKMACRAMAGEVYESFSMSKKPDLALASTHAAELSDQEAAKFEADISDIHESIRNMYSIQIRERLTVTQQELAKALAIRHAEVLERESKRIAVWESHKRNKARKHLGPNLVVGTNGCAGMCQQDLPRVKKTCYMSKEMNWISIHCAQTR